jgi:hypothetical protein
MPKWPWSRGETAASQQNLAAIGNDVAALVQAEDYSPSGADVWGRMVQEKASGLLAPATFGLLSYTVRQARQNGDGDFATSVEHVTSFLEWARDKGISVAIMLEKQRRREFTEAGAAFLGGAALDAPRILRQHQSVLLTPYGILGVKRIAPLLAQQDNPMDPGLMLRRQDRSLRVKLLSDAFTNGIDVAEQRYISALAQATSDHTNRMRQSW